MSEEIRPLTAEEFEALAARHRRCENDDGWCNLPRRRAHCKCGVPWPSCDAARAIAVVRDFRTAENWMTECPNCARLMDQNYADHAKHERIVAIARRMLEWPVTDRDVDEMRAALAALDGEAGS